MSVLNTNQLGVRLLERHALETQITMLNERIMGAEHPQSLEQYHAQLHEKRALLSKAKEEIKVMRQVQLAELQSKMDTYRFEYENTYDVHYMEELGYMERECERKIEELKQVMANEDN